MRKKKILFVFITSLAGFVFFFPFRLDGDKCCLGDSLAKSHFETAKEDDHHGESDGHAAGHDLARAYVVPYGLLWWASLALAYWSARKLIQKEETENL